MVHPEFTLERLWLTSFASLLNSMITILMGHPIKRQQICGKVFAVKTACHRNRELFRNSIPCHFLSGKFGRENVKFCWVFVTESVSVRGISQDSDEAFANEFGSFLAWYRRSLPLIPNIIRSRILAALWNTFHNGTSIRDVRVESVTHKMKRVEKDADKGFVLATFRGFEEIRNPSIEAD